MIWYDIVLYVMTWHDMIWNDFILYHIVWYDMILYCIIWYDMTWHRIISYGMIWYEFILYHMVWYDIYCTTQYYTILCHLILCRTVLYYNSVHYALWYIAISFPYVPFFQSVEVHLSEVSRQRIFKRCQWRYKYDLSMISQSSSTFSISSFHLLLQFHRNFSIIKIL